MRCSMGEEAALRQDLQVMRQAIDSYTVDKEKAPQSLDDLVQAGYLKAIPVDPMTGSSDTWMPDSSDTLMDIDETPGGINNVHSGAQGLATDGLELQHLVGDSSSIGPRIETVATSDCQTRLQWCRALCLDGRASGLRENAMRVPLVLAFAGLSATLVFAQQPTPTTPTGANTPNVTQILRRRRRHSLRQHSLRALYRRLKCRHRRIKILRGRRA